MKPWELLGWGLFAALVLFVVAIIVAIIWNIKILREANREYKEFAAIRKEQRETIRRQRGRFKL